MRSTMVLVAAGLLATSSAVADEPPKKPWSDAAEFGLVMTSGNSEGTNFALSNKFKYTWTNAEFTCDLAALRTESTTRTITNPFPYGTVVVTDTSAVTAESYVFAAKYRRNISERFYWYVGTGWYRNTFAGIDARYLVGAGIGYVFVKSPRHLLKGEIGVDGTHEDLVFGDSTDYAAIRGTVNYEFKIGEKSKLTEDLNAIENLDTTSAWRANSITAVTASINEWLALKLSYTVIYSNEPPIKLIPATPGPGPDAIYTFEKTDTILTAALVINF